MKRQWDFQWGFNPWLSVGFHFDHTDPSLTFHLPGLILAVGRLKQSGFNKRSEILTLRDVLARGAKAWLSLDPALVWEGDLGDAMETAVREIEKLRAGWEE